MRLGEVTAYRFSHALMVWAVSPVAFATALIEKVEATGSLLNYCLGIVNEIGTWRRKV